MEKTPMPTPPEGERWWKIKELYHAALALDPAAREAFLNNACADELMRREVEALLHAHEDAKPLPPIEEFLIGMYEDDVPLLKTGTLLGDYRIVELLGKGGAGAVYSAMDTQLEGSVPSPWDRKVALKVFHRHYAAFFQREARATGALKHPHIVSLHHVQWQDDICYVVMELVE